MKDLFDALKMNQKFYTLNVYNHRLGVEAGKYFADVLKVNRVCRHFRLCIYIQQHGNWNIFILLIAIATLLVVYKSTGNADVVKSIVIASPTLTQYYKLLNAYPETLACPCFQPSVSHRAYINADYVLHPICSSIFVSDQWIATLSNVNGAIESTDFRIVGPQIFQAIRSLCRLALQSIETELGQFYSSNYVSFEIIPPILFHSEFHSIIENIIASTTTKFSLSLQFIAETTQANALFSSIMSNYRIHVLPSSSLIAMDAVQYDNGCVCSRNSSCLTSITIQDLSSGTRLGYVPGFYTGCYILNALRESNLACLYNQTCLNNLANQLGFVYQMNIMALNPSSLQRFSPDMPIRILIDHLMIDEWKSIVSYKEYFDRCQPKSCTYSVRMQEEERANMITTILGIIGGMAAILNIVLFLTTSLIFEYIRRHSHSNNDS